MEKYYTFCLMVFLTFMSACKSESKKSVDAESEVIEFHEIDSQTNTNQTTADTLRIYEEYEVQRALFPLSNSQFTEFYTKNFKYPPITPVNGKGTVDLVIERNGKVSDVIIVKGIHPEIDKEFVRVLKMMPNFTPGKKDGIPIRSKYRMPITSIYR